MAADPARRAAGRLDADARSGHPHRAAAPSPSLNALAARKGRRWGSAIAWNAGTGGGSIQNPAYAAIVEGRMRRGRAGERAEVAGARGPAPNTFDFARMDQIVAWAQGDGLAVRGHTLLWHRPRWFPTWLNNYDYGANPRAEAERLLTTHIRTVTDRYRGVITSYDVVNEAIDHDTNGLMETSLSRAMGGAEAMLDLAFHTARAQLPSGAAGLQRLHELGAAARRALRRRAAPARGLPQAQRAGRRARHPVAYRDVLDRSGDRRRPLSRARMARVPR